MVVKLKNKRIPRESKLFRNAISGAEAQVPASWEPKIWLPLMLNVPQQFVTIQDDQSYVVLVPDHDFIYDAPDVSCTICGDTPYSGQALLDRDLPGDEERTCYRCVPAYLCARCRIELPRSKLSPGGVVCLACVEQNEEGLLVDNRRLLALKMFWDEDSQPHEAF